MKARQFVGSYLKKEDLQGQTPVVTIRGAKAEDFEGEGKKCVLYFDGSDKGLTLNLINTNAIVDILGTDETDDWVGKQIMLYVDENVMYMGKRTGGIRVGPPGSGQRTQAKSTHDTQVNLDAEPPPDTLGAATGGIPF